MNELIKITNENGKQTVNARELHEFLEVGKDFSDWIKYRIERFEFISEKDFTTILGKSSGGRPSTEYFLSLDMAKELSMVENNDKGKQARKYFIECEKIAKEKEASNPFLSMSPEEMMIQALQFQIDVKKRLVNVEKKLDAIDARTTEALQIEFQKPEVEANEKTKRSMINELVRTYCVTTNCVFQEAWNKLYHEFKYRYNVDLKIRARNQRVSPLTIAETSGHISDLYAVAYKIFTDVM